VLLKGKTQWARDVLLKLGWLPQPGVVARASSQNVMEGGLLPEESEVGLGAVEAAADEAYDRPSDGGYGYMGMDEWGDVEPGPSEASFDEAPSASASPSWYRRQTSRFEQAVVRLRKPRQPIGDEEEDEEPDRPRLFLMPPPISADAPEPPPPPPRPPTPPPSSLSLSPALPPTVTIAPPPLLPLTESSSRKGKVPRRGSVETLRRGSTLANLKLARKSSSYHVGPEPSTSQPTGAKKVPAQLLSDSSYLSSRKLQGWACGGDTPSRARGKREFKRAASPGFERTPEESDSVAEKVLPISCTWWRQQPHAARWLPYEVGSVSEAKIMQLIANNDRETLREHHASHLSRIYPSGTRFDSSNIGGATVLACFQAGCQMVCLNYQTFDAGQQFNRAVFRLNGGCGYVPHRVIKVRTRPEATRH
jgi:hypothetical protein